MANRIADSVICLPIYESLKFKDVLRILNIIDSKKVSN